MTAKHKLQKESTRTWVGKTECQTVLSNIYFLETLLTVKFKFLNQSKIKQIKCLSFKPSEMYFNPHPGVFMQIRASPITGKKTPEPYCDRTREHRVYSVLRRFVFKDYDSICFKLLAFPCSAVAFANHINALFS